MKKGIIIGVIAFILGIGSGCQMNNTEERNQKETLYSGTESSTTPTVDAEEEYKELLLTNLEKAINEERNLVANSCIKTYIEKGYEQTEEFKALQKKAEELDIIKNSEEADRLAKIEKEKKDLEEKQKVKDTFFDDLKTKTTYNYDEVEGASVYTHKEDGHGWNTFIFSFNIAREKNGSIFPWIQIGIQNKNWLFFKSITISVDGENFEYTPVYSSIKHEVAGGETFESVMIQVDDNFLSVLKKVSKSKKTIIRFSADNKNKDVTLSEKEKQRLSDMIEFYEQAIEL